MSRSVVDELVVGHQVRPGRQVDIQPTVREARREALHVLRTEHVAVVEREDVRLVAQRRRRGARLWRREGLRRGDRLLLAVEDVDDDVVARERGLVEVFLEELGRGARPIGHVKALGREGDDPVGSGLGGRVQNVLVHHLVVHQHCAHRVGFEARDCSTRG